MRSVSRWFPVESGLPLMAESISMTNAVIPPTFSRPRNASGQRDFQGDVCSSIATNAKMLSSDEMFRHRSHVKTLATPVWSYASMRVPKWRQQKSNLGHGSAAQCGQGSPSAVHRRTAQKEQKLVKLVLLLGEDPHSITLAVPGSRRTGPCDPGGAPHGRGEHGRPRCPVHRIPRRGKRVNPSRCIILAMFETPAIGFTHPSGGCKSCEVESYIPSPGSPFRFFPASPKYSSMGTPNTA